MKQHSQTIPAGASRRAAALKTRLLAALLACAVAIPVFSPLTAFAAAGGEPVDNKALPRPNYTEAVKCAVLFPYINGEDVVGSTLTGMYTLSINRKSTTPDKLDPSDHSGYQWYIGDTRNGAYAPIEGATEKTYQIKESDLNKYIKFEVTPRSDEMQGESLKSDPVGPVMSEDEFQRISPRLKQDEPYMTSRENLTQEISSRFSDTIYFTVDETFGGTDNTPVSQVAGSSYYYNGGQQQAFGDEKPTVADGRVMVSKEFVTSILGAPDYDFGDNAALPLDTVAQALGKSVFYGTDAVAAGANGNYRSTAQAQGLVILSDDPLSLDVVEDRDVLNEMVNQLYDLRATEEEMQWWRDSKLGMFIHWDPGTISGMEIGWGRSTSELYGPEKVTVKVPNYDLAYKDFDPTDFDAAAIAQNAAEMGCKYLVFTSKHHGGFAMWNTNFYPEHSIAGTPYGERAEQQETDIIKQLADACHAEGLKFGLYYSPQDWYNNYWASEEHYRWMDTYTGELTELLSSYGKIDILWGDAICSAMKTFDNAAPDGWTEPWGAWDPRTVLRRVKQLQPGIIVNDRYVYRWEDPKPWDDESKPNKLPADIAGDFVTPEQTTGSFNSEYAWESCLTVDAKNNWSYNGPTNAKSPVKIAGDFVNNVCNDGNVLLNIGLMPNGQFSQNHLDTFAAFGAWVQQYGEAFYNTRGGPYVEPGWGGSTYRTNEDGSKTIYLHVSPSVKGSSAVRSNTLTIAAPPDGKDYQSAVVLGHPEILLRFEKSEQGYTFTLPEDSVFSVGNSLDNLDTILRLDESFDLSVEYLLKNAELKLGEMDGAGYPPLVKNYRTSLEQKRAQLQSAQPGQEQNNAYAELSALLLAIDTAAGLADRIGQLEQRIAETPAGAHGWELSPEMKQQFQGRIAQAKEDLTNAVSDQAQLQGRIDALEADLEYFELLRQTTEVSFHPEAIALEPLAEISMSVQDTELEIRYTWDRTDPTELSKRYTGSFNAPEAGCFELRAASFYQGVQIGPVSSQYYFIDDKTHSQDLLYGVRATHSDPLADTTFIGMVSDLNRENTYSMGTTNNVSLTFDLTEPADLNTVLLYESYYADVREVRQVVVEYSNDGENYEVAATQTIRQSGVLTFDRVNARYLRIRMPNCLNPTIQEIEAYNVQTPDLSYLRLSAEQDTFLPGYYVPITLTGEIDGLPADPDQVDTIVEPADAGSVRSGVLRVNKDFTGNTITLTAQVSKETGTIHSKPITLASSLKAPTLSVEANSIAGASFPAEKAFDGNDSTYWMPNSRGTGPYWIAAKLAQPGYKHVIVKEYMDTSVFNAPNHTKLNQFTLSYHDPKTDTDVVLFDSENPSGVAYTRTTPESVQLKIADGNFMYIDQNGDRAMNVYDIEFPTTIDADNLKMTSLDPKSVSYRIFEIEVYRDIPMPELPGTDKSILNRVVEKALELKETQEYSGAILDVRESFAAALSHAQLIGQDDYAFQEEIDSAWIALMREIHKLGFQMGDKTALKGILAFANDLEMDHYVDGAAKDAFQTALKRANDLIPDENSLAQQVGEVTGELLDTLALLRLKADKSLLAQAVQQASAIDLTGYTPESVSTFEQAYNRANDLLQNPALTAEEDQQTVNQAAKELLDAIRGLTARGNAAKAVGSPAVEGDASAATSPGSPRTGENPAAAALAAVLLACAGAVLLKRKNRR